MLDRLRMYRKAIVAALIQAVTVVLLIAAVDSETAAAIVTAIDAVLTVAFVVIVPNARPVARIRGGAPNAPPPWLTGKRQRAWWEKPWEAPQGGLRGRAFRRKLWKHGYLSPNFTRREASGAHRNPKGSDVPSSLRKKAQFHAFGLERARHELGDKPLSPDGWYRDPDHNDDVGGARFSEHMEAWATDWFSGTRARHGGERFDRAMERAFANGGRGYQGHVGGPIRHVDNGARRVWVYA